MAIFCDRCRREVDAEEEIVVPTRVHALDLASLPSLSVAECDHLPAVSAVYFAMVGAVVGYIGETQNLAQRWANHPIYPRLRSQIAGRIAWLTIKDVSTRRQYERNAIRFFEPLWNRGGRGYFPETSFYPSVKDLNRRAREIRRGYQTREFAIEYYRRLGSLIPVPQM